LYVVLKERRRFIFIVIGGDKGIIDNFFYIVTAGDYKERQQFIIDGMTGAIIDASHATGT
jgi:hypothetical protein